MTIRPLHLEVPETELEQLRERLRHSRFPESETVDDWSQGVPLAVLTEFVRHWIDGYDWRRVERELNAHGQALTEIDGLDVHFLHVRSPRPDARPLIITHGWPSSVLEPLQVMDELANPADPAAPAFSVVAPSLPGFGFGGTPDRTGWSVERTADAWAELMGRLGYDAFFAAGGDWGGRVTTALGERHPDRVLGLHTFTPYVPEGDDTRLTETEFGWVSDTRRFRRFGSGYSLQQSTRPQTLGYALVDSPVALLGWILDKVVAWTDPAVALDRDKVLDIVTLYWLSATGASSIRFYWQNFPAQRIPVTVPVAVTIFPGDMEKNPLPWVQAHYPGLRSWTVAERGGHFPMLEVPDLYVREVRHALGAMV
jgi:epoxide hydrolase